MKDEGRRTNNTSLREGLFCEAKKHDEAISSCIEGIIIRELSKHTDHRGCLIECFRRDEIPADIYPEMAYMSITYPGIARGPHEHASQTDSFCFAGTSEFKLYLWDNRQESKTFGKKDVIILEKGRPALVIIPPNVVHAYKNTGEEDGLVINFPNKLYAGWGKKDKVDETRYENDASSKFKLD